MSMRDYDRSLNRLIIILHKLWKDERPTIKELSEEFQVNKRTIQRDIYQRLSIFHIDKDRKTGSFHFVDGFKLESLLIDEEMTALALSIPLTYGTNEKMRHIGDNVLIKLLHHSFKTPYYIKPEAFESIDMDSALMNMIEEAIGMNHTLIILYEHKYQLCIEPYKIVAYDGIWYVLAKDVADGKIKNFFVYKIKDAQLQSQTFIPPKLNALLDKIHTPWFEDAHIFEVIIRVSSGIGYYFELKKQLPSQKIIEKKEDGSLIISYEVTHDEEVDNLVKSWMPDIEIIEPLRLKKKLLNDLTSYLQRIQ